MTGRMNVLHIAHIADVEYSGVAVVVPNYLKYQAKHANVAFLNLANYTPHDSTDLYMTYHYENKPITTLQEPFNNPDLVIFHEVYRSPYAKIAAELRARGIPYVITPHVSLTDTAQHHKKLKKTIGNMLVFNKFINGAAAIHFLSESERMQSSSFRNISNFVCGNGIQIKGRMKKTFSEKGLKLIYMGRFEVKIKGIDRILDTAFFAQNEMRKNNISISIRGYDEANNVAWIEDTVARYGIEDIVTVAGPLFGEEKIDTILEHDCFLQLSRTEGQPLAIMEAMDIGMPCIVTEGTTFYEVVNSTFSGTGVPDDMEGIARKILELQDNKRDLAKMSVNASAYVKNAHDWTFISSTMVDYYKQVLRNQIIRDAKD